MAYESAFGPSVGFGDSQPSIRSSFGSPSFDHSRGGFRREGYGQSYGYEQQQSSGPKPKTVIRLSIQPKTQRWFASLRGGSHVYNGNSLDELAEAMASIGGDGYLEIDTVGFDYQGNAIPMHSDGCYEFRGRRGNSLPELKIVPGLSRVKCGSGKRYIKGTELANPWHAEELAEMITKYRLQALQEQAAKAERTRIAMGENNRLATEKNAKIQFDRPQLHDKPDKPETSYVHNQWSDSGSRW